MKIALDVAGGDNSPLSNIKGAIDYINELNSKDISIILIGNKQIIQSYLKQYKYPKGQIEILHTTEIVEMHEKPSSIIKKKPNSSLVQAVNLVKEKKADAIISAGNTGALLVSSLLLIGKISGIRRPAFAPYIPTKSGGFVLCDAGANADSKPHHLMQFALMANAYMKYLENIPNPRVALLNIGNEKNKGNELTINTYKILEQHLENFIGNIESRYIMDNKADVILCDGFTGNIVLKLTEGLTSHLLSWLKNLFIHEFKKNDLINEINSLFTKIENVFDHEEHGASPLLGINGIVMKCHGAASARGIQNSLKVTQKAIEKKLILNIANQLKQNSKSLNDIIQKSADNPISS